MKNACLAAVLLGALALGACSNHCGDFPGPPPDACGTFTCQPGTYCLADAGPLSCSPSKPLDASCTRDVECASLACRKPGEPPDAGDAGPGGQCVPLACF